MSIFTRKKKDRGNNPYAGARKPLPFKCINHINEGMSETFYTELYERLAKIPLSDINRYVRVVFYLKSDKSYHNNIFSIVMNGYNSNHFDIRIVTPSWRGYVVLDTIAMQDKYVKLY